MSVVCDADVIRAAASCSEGLDVRVYKMLLTMVQEERVRERAQVEKEREREREQWEAGRTRERERWEAERKRWEAERS